MLILKIAIKKKSLAIGVNTYYGALRLSLSYVMCLTSNVYSNPITPYAFNWLLVLLFRLNTISVRIYLLPFLTAKILHFTHIIKFSL